MRWLDGITDSMHTSLSIALGVTDGREAWSPVVHGVTKRHNWATELNGEKDLGAIKEVYEKYLYKSLKYIKALGPLK